MLFVVNISPWQRFLVTNHCANQCSNTLFCKGFVLKHLSRNKVSLFYTGSCWPPNHQHFVNYYGFNSSKRESASDLAECEFWADWEQWGGLTLILAVQCVAEVLASPPSQFTVQCTALDLFHSAALLVCVLIKGWTEITVDGCVQCLIMCVLNKSECFLTCQTYVPLSFHSPSNLHHKNSILSFVWTGFTHWVAAQQNKL